MYPLIKNTLIKDLIEHCPKLFSLKELYRPTVGADYVHKNNKTILYPVSYLNTMPIGDDKRIVKYITTLQKRAILARADQAVCGHSDMNSTAVLAAGYLFLNDKREVIGISNESHDFEQQSVFSLLWPLIILQIKRVPIIAQFSIIDSKAQSEYPLDLNDRIAITQALTASQRQAIRGANSSNTVSIRDKGLEFQAQSFFTGPKSAPTTSAPEKSSRKFILPTS